MPDELPARIEIGSRVLIRNNPHHAHAAGILGTVIDLRPKAGFANTDLADVRYEDPLDGEAHIRAFSVELLSFGGPSGCPSPAGPERALGSTTDASPRVHQPLDGSASAARVVELDGDIVTTPVLGGLCHHNSRAA